MKKNVGTTDKIIRVVVALIIAVLGYLYSPWLYILTAILLITAATSYCGLYQLLGIKTTKGKQSK